MINSTSISNTLDGYKLVSCFSEDNTVQALYEKKLSVSKRIGVLVLAILATACFFYMLFNPAKLGSLWFKALKGVERKFVTYTKNPSLPALILVYLKNREALENLKGRLSPHLTAVEIRKVFYAFCGGRENFSNRKDYSRTEPLENGIHLFSCEHLETNSLAVRIIIKKA